MPSARGHRRTLCLTSATSTSTSTASTRVASTRTVMFLSTSSRGGTRLRKKLCYATRKVQPQIVEELLVAYLNG